PPAICPVKTEAQRGVQRSRLRGHAWRLEADRGRISQVDRHLPGRRPRTTVRLGPGAPEALLRRAPGVSALNTSSLLFESEHIQPGRANIGRMTKPVHCTR